MRRSLMAAAGVAAVAAVLGAAGCTASSSATQPGQQAPAEATPAARESLSLEVREMAPRGTASYPLAGSGSFGLADPLSSPADFEPMVVEEDGGSRIVTPFYSVFVPDQLFPDGFDYAYSPAMPEGVWGEGLYRGCDLTVTPAGSDVPAVQAYVSSANWNGVQGEAVALSAGPVAGNPSFHVVVAGPADYGADPDGRQAREDLRPAYLLVSPCVVAADDGSGGWAVVEVPGAATLAEGEDGDGRVVVPGYAVRIDEALWPDGCLYRYYGERVPLAGGDARDFLALFDPEGPAAACLACAYEGPVEDLGSVAGPRFAWVEAPGADHVYVGAATEELARSYAAYVEG